MNDKVMSNYVIVNKLMNLIPVINPKLEGKSGIEIALLYQSLSFAPIKTGNILV